MTDQPGKSGRTAPEIIREINGQIIRETTPARLHQLPRPQAGRGGQRQPSAGAAPGSIRDGPCRLRHRHRHSAPEPSRSGVFHCTPGTAPRGPGPGRFLFYPVPRLSPAGTSERAPPWRWRPGMVPAGAPTESMAAPWDSGRSAEFRQFHRRAPRNLPALGCLLTRFSRVRECHRRAGFVMPALNRAMVARAQPSDGGSVSIHL